MQVRSITLQNFRCFKQYKVDITEPVVLIEGRNGSGKTSLLEALHYGCYLRSFRATTARDIVAFDADGFFIRISFVADDGQNHELAIGYQDKVRVVKLNGKAIESYKELMDHYRVITMLEDDMELVQGGPEIRRAFVDQAIMLHQPEYVAITKEYKEILSNRNALLAHQHVPKDMYHVWTEQLWQVAIRMVNVRMAYVRELQVAVQKLLTTYFGDELIISCAYQPKVELGGTLTDFMTINPRLHERELVMNRSLFGPHLDDISFVFSGKRARTFASRGQQKLLVLLVRLAQIELLRAQRGNAVLLVDDFMTDFDDSMAYKLTEVIVNSGCQVIFTTPIAHSELWKKLSETKAQRLAFQSE